MFGKRKRQQESILIAITALSEGIAGLSQIKGITASDQSQIRDLRREFQRWNEQGLPASDRREDLRTIADHLKDARHHHRAQLLFAYLNYAREGIKRIFANQPLDIEADQDLRILIEMDEKAIAGELLLKQMDDIKTRVQQDGIQPKTPRYNMQLTQFRTIQSQMNAITKQMDYLATTVKHNTMIQEVRQERQAIASLQRYARLSFDEFLGETESLRIERELVQEEATQFEETFQDLNDAYDLDPFQTDELREAILHTTLSKWKQEGDESFQRHLETSKPDDLYQAMSEVLQVMQDVRSKLDEHQQTDRETLLQELRDLVDAVMDDNALLQDTGGDVAKSVENFLNTNPPDIQAASIKIRSTIENHLRYHYGYDMNNRIYANTTVKEKLRRAGVPEADIETMRSHYADCNPYLHDNIEQMAIVPTETRIQQIRQAVRYVKDHQMDDVELSEVFPYFYRSDDQRVFEALEAMAPDALKQNELQKQLGYWIRNQQNKRRFIEQQEWKVPEVHFPNLDVLNDYITARQATQESSETKAPSPQAEPETLEGVIQFFHEERKFGVIKGKKGNYTFVPSSFTEPTSKEDIRDGRPVRFVPAEVNGKYQARAVRFND